MEAFHLAIDIGASSGRHIVGWRENGELKTQEVYRFSNNVKEENGHLVWDIEHLFDEVVNGIGEALKKYQVKTVAIDTWGVDYVLLDENDKEIMPMYAYRDGRTEEAAKRVHEIIPFERLYEKTGTQFQPFNTIYQLYADKMAGRLEKAADFLLTPEYLSFKLTGVKKREYTIASTTGMINAKTGQYDIDIAKALGFSMELFKEVSQPATVVGTLLPEIAQRVGGDVTVVLAPSHDTASAVEAIDGDVAYISSGTWSLIGVKAEKAVTSETAYKYNFANEGGVGYIRLLKNVTGLWLIQNVYRELDEKYSYAELADMARTSTEEAVIDVNEDRFTAPSDMIKEIEDAVGRTLEVKDLAKVIFKSLAIKYDEVIKELEELTEKRVESITIVGGGAKNKYLNELTEKYTGKKVVALPIEATAIGNLKNQEKVIL